MLDNLEAKKKYECQEDRRVEGFQIKAMFVHSFKYMEI